MAGRYTVLSRVAAGAEAVDPAVDGKPLCPLGLSGGSLFADKNQDGLRSCCFD